jgi:signal transduction histidine kinase
MLDPARQPGESRHRGLALGLGLARAVVELHGGSVGVTDLGPKGIVFTVRFPTLPELD